MFGFLGFTLLAVAGGWFAFYSIKRAKGRKWAHWVGWVVALCAGLLMVTTFVGDALSWSGDWIPWFAGSAIVVLGGVTLFDLADKRPDAGAMLGALVLPSLFALGITQIMQAADQIGETATTQKDRVVSTVEKNGR